MIPTDVVDQFKNSNTAVSMRSFSMCVLLAMHSERLGHFS